MSDHAARMMALFEGYGAAHGTHGKTERNPEKHDKLEIKKSARTVREPVTEELWQAHLSGERPIGIIPIRGDATCLWGCIDVDRYDLDHASLVRQLAEARLPLLVCKTKSGGAHVFLFMAEPVSAREIQAKLTDLAAALGLGGSEIFPKQTAMLLESGDLGNWLNMPYLGGDQTERYCVNDKGRGLTLSQFLQRAEAARQTVDEMLDLSAARKKHDVFGDGPPCLQHLSSTSFPEGTRNNGLFALGTFLKRKFPDQWEQKLEEYNQKLFDPPLPVAEVSQVQKSLRGKDYKYRCKDQPLAGHCNAGLCRTRKHGVGAAGTMPAMGSLAVLDTDQPLWFMDVAGERVELTTDELQNPARFQKVCMERIHQIVPVLKRETWTAILQGMMENLTVIDAPPEISLTGQFFEHVETFLTDRQAARDADEIILGKPWHDEARDRYYFRLRDLQEHLDKVKFSGMTRTQMTNRIREAGGEGEFKNIKGKGVNLFWLPGSLFSIQTEQHSLPTIKEDVL
jgi:hypothetical protein